MGNCSYFAVWRACRAGSDRRKVKVVKDMCIEINCKFECVASFPGSSGPGSVKYLSCPLPGMLIDCPKRVDFYQLVCDYMEKGDTRTVALWKARQVNKIPTEYDIEGEVISWRKVYRPDTVAEVEAKERAFIGDSMPALHCQPPEPKQMNIWEVLDNGAV